MHVSFLKFQKGICWKKTLFQINYDPYGARGGEIRLLYQTLIRDLTELAVIPPLS